MQRGAAILASVTLLAGCRLFRDDGDPGLALPPVPVERAGADEPAVEPDDVERFVLGEWLDPQNAGDVDGYAATLGPSFVGTVLDATGEPETLEREEWVERRSRALRRRPVVTLEEIRVLETADPARMEVEFTQTWQTETYCDTGTKRLVVEHDGEGLRVVEEVMETVSECPWASVASLLTFLDNYRIAVRKDDGEYLAAHTCLPFADETRGGDETERRESLASLEAVPTGLLARLRAGPAPRRQQVDGARWESTVRVESDAGTVRWQKVQDGELHVFSFAFEDGVWMYCAHEHEVPEQ